MRQLTGASAEKIAELWYGATSRAATTYEAMQRELAAYEGLDQPHIVLARREQTFLRQYLFRDSQFGLCALCGENLSIALLVAAHIKPCAQCSDAERRDYANNVVPMCLLGCDDLFERGWVVVRDSRVHVRRHSRANDR
jgi:hypothetical protein